MTLEPVGNVLARSWYHLGRADGLASSEPMPIVDGMPEPLARAYHDGYEAGRCEAGLPPGETPRPMGGRRPVDPHG